MVITLVIVALALLLAGAFALSTLAERVIAGSDWGLTEDAATHYTITEGALREGVQAFLEPYALDAIDDVQADFRPPDTIELSLLLRSQPLRLEARLAERSGVPTITLERLNDVPLYVVGGIISNGINRGFEEAWEGAPVQIATMTVGEEQLTITLRGVP